MFAWLVAVVTLGAYAQSPPTNRVRLDSCIRRTVRDASTRWNAGAIEISVDASTNSILLSAALSKVATGNEATAAPSRKLHARVVSVETKYALLGDDRIARTISFWAAFELQSADKGTLVTAWESGMALTDTVQCGMIPAVERGDDLPALHAQDPCASESGAFSSIIEPALLAVASATIIILLFTLRGH